MPATADAEQPPDSHPAPLPAVCSRRAVMFGAAGIVGTVLVSACGPGSRTASPAASDGSNAAAPSSAQPSGVASSPASTSSGTVAPSSASQSAVSPSGTTAAATPTRSPRAGTDPTPSPARASTPTPSKARTTTPAPSPTTPTKPAGTVLAALSAVPTGGSLVVRGPNGPVALARSSANQVVAHTAICTHMGCTVGAAGGTLKCPCHGSQYNAFTGAVLRGPAPDPLQAITVHVDGGQIVTP